MDNRVKLQLEARASGAHWRSLGCQRFKEVPPDGVEFLALLGRVRAQRESMLPPRARGVHGRFCEQPFAAAADDALLLVAHCSVIESNFENECFHLVSGLLFE